MSLEKTAKLLEKELSQAAWAYGLSDDDVFCKVRSRDDKNLELSIGIQKSGNQGYFYFRAALSSIFTTAQIQESGECYYSDQICAGNMDPFIPSSFKLVGRGSTDFFFIGDPLDIRDAIGVVKRTAPNLSQII
jgi:hypothetical protein